MSTFKSIFLALAVFVASSLASPAFAADAPAPDGAKLFKYHCAACHGLDGTGGTGPSLRGKLSHGSHAAMTRVIKSGIPGSQMPAATGLSDGDIDKVIAHVKMLRKSPPKS